MVACNCKRSILASGLYILGLWKDFKLFSLVGVFGRLCQKNKPSFASYLLVPLLLKVFSFAECADFQVDGGGIRGYSTLLLLKAVFEEIEDIQGHPVLPCELFDMIAGTSTGG